MHRRTPFSLQEILSYLEQCLFNPSSLRRTFSFNIRSKASSNDNHTQRFRSRSRSMFMKAVPTKSSGNLHVDQNKDMHLNLLNPNVQGLKKSNLHTLIYKQRKLFFCTKSNLPVLTLYTKDACPLCDEALNVLSPYLHQVVLEKVDITKQENKHWWNEYRYDIPVFHLNGKFLMKHKASTDLFLNALKNISNLEE